MFHARRVIDLYQVLHLLHLFARATLSAILALLTTFNSRRLVSWYLPPKGNIAVFETTLQWSPARRARGMQHSLIGRRPAIGAVSWMKAAGCQRPQSRRYNAKLESGSWRPEARSWSWRPTWSNSGFPCICLSFVWFLFFAFSSLEQVRNAVLAGCTSSAPGDWQSFKQASKKTTNI